MDGHSTHVTLEVHTVSHLSAADLRWLKPKVVPPEPIFIWKIIFCKSIYARIHHIFFKLFMLAVLLWSNARMSRLSRINFAVTPRLTILIELTFRLPIQMCVYRYIQALSIKGRLRRWSYTQSSPFQQALNWIIEAVLVFCQGKLQGGYYPLSM